MRLDDAHAVPPRESLRALQAQVPSREDPDWPGRSQAAPTEPWRLAHGI